jgi:hypothetical protein
MGTIPKREFLDLEVEEVSLVDKAANEQVFVVIKSLNQEDDMADTEVKKTEKQDESVDEGTAQQEKIETVEKVAVGEIKTDDTDVAKVLKEVTTLVESIAGKVNEHTHEQKTEVAKAKTEDEVAEGETAEVKKDDAGETAEDGKEKVEKAAEPVLDSLAVIDAIQKALTQAQTFTPQRAEKLLDVAKQLQAVVDGITGTVASQPESAPPQKTGNDEAISNITKSLNNLIDLVKGQVEVNKSLGDRIEKIEKVKNPSTSLEDDGDTVTEEKTQKSFWSGVL